MPGHIVIIDSYEKDALQMKKILSDMCDYSIHIVESYSEFAVAALPLDKISLIIIDINLGTESEGIETLKRIRQIPQYIMTPIIIITNLDKPYATGIGQEYSVYDYILKPYKPDRFIKSLKPLLIKELDHLNKFTCTPVIEVKPVEYLERELQIAVRTKTAISLIIISPSYKKDDNLSELVFKRVCEFLRTTDKALLNDNGEIIVILPATDEIGASIVLEKMYDQLKDSFSNYEIDNYKECLCVSVSYPQNGDSIKKLIESAYLKLNCKRELEKVCTLLHRNMARVCYVYQKNTKKNSLTSKQK